MKSFNLFLVLLFLILLSQSYSQNLNDLTPAAKEYMSKLNGYRENVTVSKEEFIGEIDPQGLQQVDMLQLTVYKVNKKIEGLPLEEFKQLVKLRNEAIEEDPYKLNEYYSKDSRETSKKLDKNSNTITIKLSAIDGMINNRISKIYNNEIAKIHRIQTFAKVKIIGRSDEIYESEPSAKIHITNYVAIVEDICRGYNVLKVGGQTTFYIINQWKRSNDDFEIGKSYFIGCFTIINKLNEKRLALATNELNDGIYPIENDKVIDYPNSFGIGHGLSWNSFKTKLSNILNLNY